jgi:hypothetical protein
MASAPCNPRCMGGRDQGDHSWRPVWAKFEQDPISTNNLGLVTFACHPSYEEGINRRDAVQDSLEKSGRPCSKRVLQKGLRVLFKRSVTWLVSAKPWVQTIALPKRKRGQKESENMCPCREHCFSLAIRWGPSEKRSSIPSVVCPEELAWGPCAGLTGDSEMPLHGCSLFQRWATLEFDMFVLIRRWQHLL